MVNGNTCVFLFLVQKIRLSIDPYALTKEWIYIYMSTTRSCESFIFVVIIRNNIYIFIEEYT